DQRYTFVNRAYAQLLGLTPDQIIGKHVTEILGPDAYESVRPYIERVLEGHAVEYETEVPYQRIGVRFMRVAYRPDKDDRGNIIGWVASISDITERKRALEARQRSEALKAAILDCALDCIVSIDEAGRV